MPAINPRVPEPERPLKHETPIQLRFNDIDMFGHVNNAVYVQFFDLGKLRYFEDVLGKDFAQKGFTAVVVNVNCDFFAPTLLHEKVSVFTAVSHLGEKSVTLEQRLVNTETDEVKSICRTVMAGFDPSTFKSSPIPVHFRNTISVFEAIQ